MKQVITPCGKYGTVTAEKNEQCEVRYYNGKTNWFRKHQLTELTAKQRTKPPSRERDALISKYKTMLDDCRNEGAMAVLVMILNDFK